MLRSESEFWQPWFRAAGLDWSEPLRGPKYNDASHLMQAAVEGQGVALARSSLIGNDIVNGVLVRLSISRAVAVRYYLVYPRGSPGRPSSFRSGVAARRDRARRARDCQAGAARGAAALDLRRQGTLPILPRSSMMIHVASGCIDVSRCTTRAGAGGSPGLRNKRLLEWALARPRNLAVYGEPDLADLAVAYGAGLAKNHAFVDGSKRAAFLAVGLFLGLNGYRLDANQADATLTMLALASGDLDEPALAAWIREHSRRR